MGETQGKPHYEYRQYYQIIRDYAHAYVLTSVIDHEPCQELYVDWPGDTMRIIDPIDGSAFKTYTFVAALPFSELIYAKAYKPDPRIVVNRTPWLDIKSLFLREQH